MLGKMGKGMSLLLSMDGADDQRMEKVCAIMLEMEKPEMNKPVEINRKENLRDHHFYWIGRRTQDIVLSSLALVILSPVMLITAIAIVVDDLSAGPIFSQVRVGRNGKLFRLLTARNLNGC